MVLLAVAAFAYFRSNDPVKGFQSFAKKFVAHYEGLNKKRMENAKKRGEAYSVKYNVISIEKTNDLVHPYLANLTVEKSGPGSYGQVHIVFVFRDEKWQYKSHRLGGAQREGLQGVADYALEGFEIQESADVANGVEDATSLEKSDQRARKMLN